MTTTSRNFIQSTFVSGVVFLLPVALITVALGNAVLWVRELILPIIVALHFENIIGTGLPLLFAVLAIVISCFVAGLSSRLKRAKKFIDQLESLLSHVPGYTFIKSVVENIVGIEENKVQEVVLAWVEESWQLAFVNERLDNGLIAVYVLGAPSPTSGSLYFMTEEKIKKIDLTPAQALLITNRTGIGANKLMKDKLPAA